MTPIGWTLCAFVSSAIVTGVLRSWALRRRLLDVPNARSSHVVPTPRGGGLAIVFVSLGGSLVALGAANALGASELGLLIGGAIVAFVGFMDDARSLGWRVRLLAHFAAVVGLSIALGDGVSGAALVGAELPGIWLLLVIAGAWCINLFNFMDGIDGIAGSEAVFIAASTSAILAWSNDVDVLTLVPLQICAGGSLGFLVWNFPRARIFMGDSGSGFLGFFLFAATLVAVARAGVSVVPVAILWGCFVIDATFTLVSRVRRGGRWHEAHRSHVYQRLSRHWASHPRVTLAFAAINVAWLLPAATVAAIKPSIAWFVLIGAWLPLALAAIWLGAGRADEIGDGRADATAG